MFHFEYFYIKLTIPFLLLFKKYIVILLQNCNIFKKYLQFLGRNKL